MKANTTFEDLLPAATREDVVMGGVRQVMGLAMAMSLLAMVVVMLGLMLP